MFRESESCSPGVIEDVMDCLEKKRTPLVLTKSGGHTAWLYEYLQDKTDHIFLLHGSRSEKESSLIRQQMKAVPEDETIVLVATGQYIGEVFNYPRLDTMMLAMPVAWQGNVEQYSGRLYRDYEAKKDVIIYDYVDAHIKVLEGMYHKQLRTYKRMGYEICLNLTSEKQQTNSIFDSGTYLPVFEKDLAEANREIVVSSPGLNVPKVKAFIKQVKAAQENGVQVVVLTLSPDRYPAGRIEITRRLVGELEHARIHVLPHETLHEHYAVIDHEIV